MNKEIIAAITEACDALHNLEMVSVDDNTPLSQESRSMLDTLESHLRILDPESYSS